MRTCKRIKPSGLRNRHSPRKPKPLGPLGTPLDLLASKRTEDFGTPRFVAMTGEFGDTYLDAADYLLDLLRLLRKHHHDEPGDVVVWQGDKVAAIVLAGGEVVRVRPSGRWKSG